MIRFEQKESCQGLNLGLSDCVACTLWLCYADGNNKLSSMYFQPISYQVLKQALFT